MLLAWTVLTVKFAGLVAVPPGVVTVILPVVAPVGTVAVICVAEFTWNVVAATLLNFTELVVKLVPPAVPLKFVPVIVTDVPTGPNSGVNEVIVGAGTGVTVKTPELRAVFPATVTRIGPVVAPVGTVAVIWVALFTTTPVADVWLNFTVAPAAKPVPVITTDVPTTPLVGLKPVTVTGHAVPGVSNPFKVSVCVVGAVSVTAIWAAPVAVAGTTAEICVVESVVNTAVRPSIVTAETVSKPVPVILTSHPTGTLSGEKDKRVWLAAAGPAVSPTINITPTSETQTRTSARFPTCRPRSFMASTSFSRFGDGSGAAPPHRTRSPLPFLDPKTCCGARFPQDEDLPSLDPTATRNAIPLN
jgi:hypothetical protein